MLTVKEKGDFIKQILLKELKFSDFRNPHSVYRHIRCVSIESDYEFCYGNGDPITLMDIEEIYEERKNE